MTFYAIRCCNVRIRASLPAGSRTHPDAVVLRRQRGPYDSRMHSSKNRNLWQCEDLKISAKQIGDDTRSSGERCVNLRLIFATGFGDFRLAAAGAAHKFRHGADEFAGLDALC